MSRPKLGADLIQTSWVAENWREYKNLEATVTVKKENLNQICVISYVVNLTVL